MLLAGSEMKCLHSTGKYLEKPPAQPMSGSEGDSFPSVLLSTMVWQIGLYFSLRSGQEHCWLTHSSSQITLVEPRGEKVYLVYKEHVLTLIAHARV